MTMYPHVYHQNAFLETHALGHMMYSSCVPNSMSCHKAIVVITTRAHCFHDCIYTYIYIHIYIYKLWVIEYSTV